MKIMDMYVRGCRREEDSMMPPLVEGTGRYYVDVIGSINELEVEREAYYKIMLAMTQNKHVTLSLHIDEDKNE